MPTYLQVVRGYSAAKSGCLMTPMVGGFLVGVLMHGCGVSLTGRYVPSILFTSALMPLATILITTWKLSTSLTKLVPYSLLAGFSYAIGFMGSQTAAQTVLSKADAPLRLSVIMMSAQHFVPALRVGPAQTIFTNRLVANLRVVVPGLTSTTMEDPWTGRDQVTHWAGQDGAGAGGK